MRSVLAALALVGCTSGQAVTVNDPSQSTDTGIDIASLGISATEFVISHVLDHEEARQRIGIALPDGGIMVLRVVSASPLPESDAGR